jgi:hypothetical protein
VAGSRFSDTISIKIQDTRMIRLMEVFLHGGTRLAGWSATQIHQAILSSFQLSANHYGLPRVRFDLRKMKAHDLLQRDRHHYTYRLTDKGVKVAPLFLFFHKRLCGPLASSLFHRRPDGKAHPKVPLEAAYHKADDAIQEIIHLLKAACCYSSGYNSKIVELFLFRSKEIRNYS